MYNYRLTISIKHPVSTKNEQNKQKVGQGAFEFVPLS